MALALESSVTKVLGKAVAHVGGTLRKRIVYEAVRQDARPVTAKRSVDMFVRGLSPKQARGLKAFLESPDFETLTLNVVLARCASIDRDEDSVEVRDSIRAHLKQFTLLKPDQLTVAADAIVDDLMAATVEYEASFANDARALALLARKAAAITRAGQLASELKDITQIHNKLETLRGQIRGLHGEIRLPHAGVSRSVPWRDLYVQPDLRLGTPLDATREESRSVVLRTLLQPGSRTVILGDPGAGKSTLLTKLAYDVSVSELPFVPLHLVLRDHISTLRQGGKAFIEYLCNAMKSPYNIDLSIDEMEYILLSGRAAVLIDGLDELGDVGLRQRVVDLVDGFAMLFPLAPLIATSRAIGYQQAPLPHSRFNVCAISPFDDEKVFAYATNWFAHENAVKPSEREVLRDSFMRESESIADLRSNPLLLSLLCAMYSSEHYIPRNRAQVYERCALMVFDRWDRMRDIPNALRFEGHLRGAVQFLAWHLFAALNVPELSGRKIQRVVRDYLIEKNFDPDDAEALAGSFLEFCAGRSWILDSMGTGSDDDLLGFSHRTFMEYFAAEYLVRKHGNPENVYSVVAGKVGDSNWSVVLQLTLQLLDRNLDSGAEQFLAALLDDESVLARPGAAVFLARACGHVALSPRLLARVVPVIMNALEQVSTDRRKPMWLSDMATGLLPDEALSVLLEDSLESNLNYVQQAVLAYLDNADPSDNLFHLIDQVGVIYDGGSPHGNEEWLDGLARLDARRASEIYEWRTSRVSRILTDRNIGRDQVMRLLDANEPQDFYRATVFEGVLELPLAIGVLANPNNHLGPKPANDAAFMIAEKLLNAERPWLPVEWWEQFAEAQAECGVEEPILLTWVRKAGWPHDGANLAAFITLLLPYFETHADRLYPAPFYVRSEVSSMLVTTRYQTKAGETRDVRATLASVGLPAPYCDFLDLWANNQLSVLTGT
ncbi:NACHT domain-containing protein [Catellatospora methionotrophica]|uniref:NACHT domain-containing protein n=1 Tax=Catellatospora methionotrophica TaxID=121620 RepID=UPI003403EF26